MRKVYTRLVLERFMTPKQIEMLDSEYSDNLRTIYAARLVTEQDMRILDSYIREKLTSRELARKYGMTAGKIQTAIKLAAVEKVKMGMR